MPRVEPLVLGCSQLHLCICYICWRVISLSATHVHKILPDEAAACCRYGMEVQRTRSRRRSWLWVNFSGRKHSFRIFQVQRILKLGEIIYMKLPRAFCSLLPTNTERFQPQRLTHGIKWNQMDKTICEIWRTWNFRVPLARLARHAVNLCGACAGMIGMSMLKHDTCFQKVIKSHRTWYNLVILGLTFILPYDPSTIGSIALQDSGCRMRYSLHSWSKCPTSREGPILAPRIWHLPLTCDIDRPRVQSQRRSLICGTERSFWMMCLCWTGYIMYWTCLASSLSDCTMLYLICA